VDGDLAGALTNNFTLQAGVSWIYRRYTSYPDCPSYVPTPTGGNVPTTINCTGHMTAHSPGFGGDVGAEYRMPTNVGELSYNLTFSYSTGCYPDPVTAFASLIPLWFILRCNGRASTRNGICDFGRTISPTNTIINS
jgi:hypothetical protein